MQLTSEALVADSNDSKQIEDFITALRDNMVKCGSQATKSIYMFCALFTSWVLVYIDAITTIPFLGIEIKDTDILLLILAPLSAFSLYRYQLSITLADIIDATLKKLYASHFKAFEENNLTELLTLPSFFTIENALANLEPDSGFIKKFAENWAITLGILMTLIPIAALGWSCIILICKETIDFGWSVLSVGLILLLVTRTVFIFIQWMRQV